MKRLAAHAEEHGYRIPTLLQAQSLWRRDVQFNVLSCGAFCKAVLQRSQSRTVLRRVGVDAIGVESLAKHQERLAMRIWVAGFNREIDIGSERYIAGDLLPHKVEGINRRPQIRAGGSDGIGMYGR